MTHDPFPDRYVTFENGPSDVLADEIRRDVERVLRARNVDVELAVADVLAAGYTPVIVEGHPASPGATVVMSEGEYRVRFGEDPPPGPGAQVTALARVAVLARTLIEASTPFSSCWEIDPYGRHGHVDGEDLWGQLRQALVDAGLPPAVEDGTS